MCENLWSLMQKYAKLSIYKVILLVVVKFSLSQLKSDCNVGVQPTNMFLSFKLQKRSNRGVWQEDTTLLDRDLFAGYLWPSAPPNYFGNLRWKPHKTASKNTSISTSKVIRHRHSWAKICTGLAPAPWATVPGWAGWEGWSARTVARSKVITRAWPKPKMVV